MSINLTAIGTSATVNQAGSSSARTTSTGNVRDNFVPWGLRPIQSFVFKELANRSESYGFEADALNNYNSEQNFTVARSAWVRVCSNGKIPAKISDREKYLQDQPLAENVEFREGFIMHGVHGFNKTYGISEGNENSGKVVLGYDVDGKEHVLDDQDINTFQNRPGPGVTSIESEFYGAGSSFNGLCRKITIKWRANSIDQLNYMMPYFMSPMMTVVIEFGWNVYNSSSSNDTSTTADGVGSGLRGYYTNSQLLQNKIEASNGNYDAFIGRIIDFNFSLTRDNTFDCTTVVVNANYMVQGTSTDDSSISTNKNNKEEPPSEILNFKKFVSDNILDNAIGITTADRFSSAWDAIKKDRWKNLIPYRSTFTAVSAFRSAASESKNVINDNDFLKNFFKKAYEEKKFFWEKSIEAGTNNLGSKKYLSFEVFIKLLNYFYGKNSNGATFNYIDIEDVQICAHPLIKSIDRDILIPNKFAPKFWKKNDNATAGTEQEFIESTASTIVDAEYGKLLGNLGNTIKSLIDDDEVGLFYDDIDHIINSGVKGREFPQTNAEGGPAGYWGYLKHIYISTDLIKTYIEQNKNSTYVEFLNAILDKINNAAGRIFKLRIVPKDADHNSQLTIIDDNYINLEDAKIENAINNPIFIGSINSSFILNASLDVKLTTQMANQALFGNAVYDYRSKKDGTIKNTSDSPPPLYIFTDRLFGEAETNVTETVTEKKKSKYNTSASINDFLYVQRIRPAPTDGEISSADERIEKAKETLAPLDTARIQASKDTFSNRRSTGRLADIAAATEAYTKALTEFNLAKSSRSKLNPKTKLYSILVEKDASVQNIFRRTEQKDTNGKIIRKAMYIHNAIMPDTELSLEFLGIAGIRFLDTFTIDGVLEPYTYTKCIWQVDRVNHSVSGNNWKTSIVAKARPHRFFDKDKGKDTSTRPNAESENL
jgi:hypothetical protein